MSKLAKSRGISALSIAIVAAIIGGLFTFVPIIYDSLTNRYELSFNINESSVLGAGNEKQIFIFDLENTGSKTIQDIIISVTVPNAIFSDVSINVPPGIKFSNNNSTPLLVEISELNSGEAMQLAFLVAASRLSGGDYFSVRAKDLPAGAIVDRKENVEFWQVFGDNSVAGFASVAAFTGIVAILTQTLLIAIRRQRFLSTVNLGYISEEDNGGSIDKNIAIPYIKDLLFPDVNTLLVHPEITWAEFADQIFLSTRRDEIEFSLAFKAFACLLRCDDKMAPRSKQVITRHVKVLFGEFGVESITTQEFRTSDIRNDFENIVAEIDVPELLERHGK